MSQNLPQSLSHNLAQKWLAPWFSSFLRDPCALCQRPSAQPICPTCKQQIQTCQLPLASFQGWAPVSSPLSPLPVIAWGNYAGPLKRALSVLKYQHCPTMGQLLGHNLGLLWQQQAHSCHHQIHHQTHHQTHHQSCPLVAVPIPLHPDRLRERGYNQAQVIAESFCRITQIPLLSQGLCRVRATAMQHALGPRERAQNLRSAFRLGTDWTMESMRSQVLLIDDIYTTGTTAEAAALVLRQAGIAVIGIATVAKAPEHPRRAP
jgi:ComF family protein